MCRTAPKQLIRRSEKFDTLIISFLPLPYAITLSGDFAGDLQNHFFGRLTSLHAACNFEQL